MRQTRPQRSFIPWIFVIGMAVVIVVNGVLIYSAISTWKPQVIDESYERGREYNDALARTARQDALGWRIEANVVHGEIGRAHV